MQVKGNQEPLAWMKIQTTEELHRAGWQDLDLEEAIASKLSAIKEEAEAQAIQRIEGRRYLRYVGR